VLVLDRAETLGAGSTGRATGGFRCQFTTEINVRLSLLAREKLLRFPDEIGVDSGYRPYGYLFCATTEAQMALLRQALAVQHAAGAHASREVSVDEIRQINPALQNLHRTALPVRCRFWRATGAPRSGWGWNIGLACPQ
jgi:sarcosine oxidase subunit beta